MRDLDSLTSWHADWSGLRVVVLGLGVTGFSVADTLAELGAEVLVVAANATDERRQMLEVIGARFADEASADLPGFDPELVVVSPGFPLNNPVLIWAQERGTAVWGDIELAWRLRDKLGDPADWIAITGTNGKTTTTQMLASILTAAGLRTAAVGNIGRPLMETVLDPEPFDVLVVELSSHQLHWFGRNDGGEIAPLASVCLNLADDHLLWHGSAEAYRDAKAKVYAHTRIACVYNLADEATMRMVEDAEVQEGARAIGFGLGIPSPSNVGIVEDVLVDRAFLDDRRTSALELGTLDDLRGSGLASRHMAQNVLAAAALARAAGVAPAAIRDAIRTFRVGPHRTETVLVAGEVTWVDDSKATNADAAAASLAAFESVVWVVGGLLKGIDIAPLVRDHAERLRAAVVIGADREAVRDAFSRHAPGVRLVEVDEPDTDRVMPAAVAAAHVLALPGDVVLLAPSAASMDQFTDYADRGRRFADAVREQAERGARDHDAPAGDGQDAPTRHDDAERGDAAHDSTGPHLGDAEGPHDREHGDAEGPNDPDASDRGPGSGSGS